MSSQASPLPIRHLLETERLTNRLTLNSINQQSLYSRKAPSFCRVSDILTRFGFMITSLCNKHLLLARNWQHAYIIQKGAVPTPVRKMDGRCKTVEACKRQTVYFHDAYRDHDWKANNTRDHEKQVYMRTKLQEYFRRPRTRLMLTRPNVRRRPRARSIMWFTEHIGIGDLTLSWCTTTS